MPKKSAAELVMESRFVSLEICLKDMEHAIDEQTCAITNLVDAVEEDSYMDVLNSIDASLKYIVNRAKGKVEP